MYSMKPLAKAIIILPGTVLVFIPSALLYISYLYLGKTDIISVDWRFIALSVPFFIIGMWLSITAVRLFTAIGEGTPAPWNPPGKLVIAGPYRYVRNPMISGVLFMLAGESLLFWSWLILGWLAVFLIANSIYFPFFEEKGLIKRFGDEYLEYKKNVPRWLPRFSPYNKKIE